MRKVKTKISKDLNNQNWLIDRNQTSLCKSNKRKKEEKKKRPSLKVSLPIRIWDAMQESNAQFNTPTSNNTSVHRSSQLSVAPSTHSMPSSASDLRMIRHPVPTSKGRTSFADKLDQIVKFPKQTIPPKMIFQRTTTMPLIPGDGPTKAPANDPLQNKTEESINANRPKTPAETFFLKSNNAESQTPIKHKLPFSIVPPKGSYFKKPTNPINKENTLTQATAEQETQTEKCFVVNEEEVHILEIVKNSGLSSEELQSYLMRENKNDEKVVIDLENDSEEDVNDMYAKIMKHSTDNKFVLSKIAKILQKSYSLTSNPLKHPHESPSSPPFASAAPITAAAGASSECTMRSPITEDVAVTDTLKPGLNPQNFESNDLQKGIAVSAMLLQMGLRIVRIEPQTQGTQTDETNKKRKLQYTTDENQTDSNWIDHHEQNVQRTPVVPVPPYQEFHAAVPQIQDISIFHPHNTPRQQQPHQQPHQYASEHIKRPVEYYPHMSGLMAHQRATNSSTRGPHLSSTETHIPYEHNRNNNTFSTSQTPAPMQNQGHLYPTNQGRQSSLGQPYLSRVMSTHEANMHGSQVQKPGWGYPHYCDIKGNPQRHQ